MKSLDVSAKDAVTLAVISSDVKYIQKDVAEINRKLELSYVTREELDPIKKIVYGLVSLVLVAVVGALLSILFKK